MKCALFCGFSLCLNLVFGQSDFSFNESSVEARSNNPEQIIERDTIEFDSAQNIIGLSFSAVYSSIPTASFHLYKTKIEYARFIRSNFQIAGGLTFYQAESNFNAFDRSFMVNANVLGKFFWRKFHVDLGMHGGNYAEFVQNIDSRPNFLLYASVGGGITIPIFKKLTLDLEAHQLIATNRFPKYLGPNPFEAFFGVNYIIDGSNHRFRRTKAKIKVASILRKNTHLIGYGFSAGAFNWPSNEGVPFTYMMQEFCYQYFLKNRWSISGTLFSTFAASSAEMINGIDKKMFNTLNFNLGSNYHLGAFFTGAEFSLGSYSAFSEGSNPDRNTRFYFHPQMGINLKITKSVLFEFRARYAISLNHTFNSEDPSDNYILGTLGLKVKLNGQK